jgi:hypothetical protein
MRAREQDEVAHGVVDGPGRARTRCLPLAGLVLAALLWSPTIADARIEIVAPGLSPAFSPGVHDYAVSCSEPTKLRVRTPGSHHARARIADRRRFTGARRRSIQLAPAQAIKVSNQRRRGKPIRTYFIRCLPADFPAFHFTRETAADDELYMVSPMGFAPTTNYTFVLTARGVPVWWMKTTPPSIDAKVLTDDTIAWAYFWGGTYGTDDRLAYQIRSLDGRVVRTLKTAGTITDHHELLATPQGNYVLVSYRPRSGVDFSVCDGDADATVLDSVIQEVTPRSDSS